RNSYGVRIRTRIRTRSRICDHIRIGGSAGSFVGDDHDFALAQPDHGAGLHLDAFETDVVQEGAVGRGEVTQSDAVAEHLDEQVLPGDGRVVEDEVASRVLAHEIAALQ